MIEVLTKYALYLITIFIILLLTVLIIFVSLEFYTYIKEMIEEFEELKK